MTYQLDNNEFTDWELLQYLRATFIVGPRSRKLDVRSLNNLSKYSYLPAMYGGNRVWWQRYAMLGNIRVWRIEGLTRAILTEDVLAFEPMNNYQKAQFLRKKPTPLQKTNKSLKETLKKLIEKSDKDKDTE